jgi:hypothetical protein
MPDNDLPTAQILAMLAAGPPRIAEYTAGLTPAQLAAPPAPGEWSARDVLAHLRACGDVWGRYIATILNEDRPTIQAISPRTWIRRTDYLTLPFHPSFEAFAAQRAELVALLEPLPAAAWSRAATMTGAGRPLEQTLYSYANGLAIHERPHLKQIRRIAAALRA